MTEQTQVNDIDFNYEQRHAQNLTVENLLRWISDLHGELTDLGLLPGDVSDETHLQIMILAKEAEQ